MSEAGRLIVGIADARKKAAKSDKKPGTIFSFDAIRNINEQCEAFLKCGYEEAELIAEFDRTGNWIVYPKGK